MYEIICRLCLGGLDFDFVYRFCFSVRSPRLLLLPYNFPQNSFVCVNALRVCMHTQYCRTAGQCCCHCFHTIYFLFSPLPLCVEPSFDKTQAKSFVRSFVRSCARLCELASHSFCSLRVPFTVCASCCSDASSARSKAFTFLNFFLLPVASLLCVQFISVKVSSFVRVYTLYQPHQW